MALAFILLRTMLRSLTLGAESGMPPFVLSALKIGCSIPMEYVCQLAMHAGPTTPTDNALAAIRDTKLSMVPVLTQALVA
jgi:hypothetical protein